MKRSRFIEEQIIAILEEQEAGMASAEMCRRHGISSATFYKWKSKYGGPEVSEARRLRALEDENARREAGSRSTCPCVSRFERASGVQSGWRQPARDPVSIDAGR